MAITTRDRQDDGLLDAAPDQQRLTEPAPLSQDGEDVERIGSRSARRPAWIAVLAAIAVAVVLIIMLLAETVVAAAGEASLAQLLAVCLVAVVGLAGSRYVLRRSGPRGRRSRQPTRIAIIGNQSSAVSLLQELVVNKIGTYEVAGWIASGSARGTPLPLPQALGPMEDLASLVEQHRIDLLLIGSDIPRLMVFDELVRLTDILRVRVCELSAFYEDAFGHIPVAEINSAWFQYVMHPRFRPTTPRLKRVFDLALSTVLAVAFLPLLVLAALLIKLDGGRVLYRQNRIGEKGRPFTMYKLRTMRERPADEPETWSSVNDPRITRVGRVLRKLHIDELAQLYNVLRGEMSIVGPRPEQPNIVSRLEEGIAFYSRRHLIKPGLAGWAQLRCGYARTERGSAWKLCHDLYYLKHRSLRFDIVILVRTFLTLARQVVSRDVTADVPEAHPAPAQPSPASARY
jgi:exopolysaccharide biosynthesis polyprenyl glycosylphosphotransferase